jgi:hypothetical protein
MRTVDTTFTDISTAKNRRLAYSVNIAWERTESNDTIFAIVGTSQIDGVDIVKGEIGDLTRLDIFGYTEESEYAQHLEFEQQLIEPLGGVSYAQGAVILANSDDRFLLGGTSEIASYILPNRPIKLFMGFEFGGLPKLLTKIMGLTRPPEFNTEKTLVTIKIFDFLVFLQDLPIGEDVVYINQRSDQIIADLLENKAGFASSQFELDLGLNTIGFAHYTNEKSIASILKEICEAEGGYIFQDENGVIRFWNRNKWLESPYNEPVISIGKSMNSEIEVIDWIPTINRVRVKSTARQVQAESVVYEITAPIEMSPLQTMEIFPSFEDPVAVMENIVVDAVDVDSDFIANSQSDGLGTDKRDDVTVSSYNFVTAAKITLVNTLNETVFITKLQIRGQLATESVPEIDEIYEDEVSQANYGIKEVIIDNNSINDAGFAAYLAEATVKKYSSPLQLKRIKIRALPQLQVGDLIMLSE